MVSLSPQYLPPQIDNKKHKRKWILLVVFLLVIALLVLAWFTLFSKPKPEPTAIFKSYSICGFDPEVQQEKFLEREELGIKAFNDYHFYGESLNIYEEKYNRDEQDPFVGQTLQFRDLCTDTIHSFLIGRKIDANVPLSELPVGFYQVVIQNNLDGFRLVYPTPIDDSLVTITRDNKRHEIHLIANRTLFTNILTQEPLLSDNELFVEVKEVGVDDKVLDIVLDPANNHADFGPINMGTQLDGFNEANETYRFALDVKAELEKYNLKVGMTRPNKELTVNTYGDTGRVYAAMSQDAKLMVEIYFESVNDTKLQGTSVYGSNYASLNFQEILIKQFDARELPIFIGSRGQFGSFTNPFLREMDMHNLIRESGGYALGAGEFSERSTMLNGFAINNKHGVHTVSLNLLMTSNPNFMNLYQSNYQQMVEATTQGILEYLRIKP